MLKQDIKPGMQVEFSFRGKHYSGIVTKINRKYVVVQDSNQFYSVDPSYLKECDGLEVESTVFTYDRSGITTNADLVTLLREVKDEYGHVFTKIFMPIQMEIMDSVTIHFGNRVTHRKFGSYTYGKNRIYITKTLKNAPAYAIKKVIYHELLHIKWGHTPTFRRYERLFKDYDKAMEFIKNIARSVLVHGEAALNFTTPTIKEHPETTWQDWKGGTELDSRFAEIKARLARQRASMA